MADESEVERALLAIEARFAGVAASHEGRGSAAARDRLIERLSRELAEPPVEAQFSGLQPWVQYLLLKLARRYGVTAYRRKGQRKTTVFLALPEGFTQEVFEPAVNAMSKVLEAHLLQVTKRIVDRALDSVAKSDVRLPQWELDE